MFCSPPAPEDRQSTSKKSQKSRRRRKKKRSIGHQNAVKRDIFQKKSSLAMAMSSWAENFTAVASYQLKHQLAYWKARAVSLEHENKVLHDIIRKNHDNIVFERDESESEIDEPVTKTNDESMTEGDDDDFEVSEEFIEFLRVNAKYKEDARIERERFKNKSIAEENREIEELEAGPSGPPEDKQKLLKELYGDKWERIAALEMSVQSKFMTECDCRKPVYWPNIPLNFQFS